VRLEKSRSARWSAAAAWLLLTGFAPPAPQLPYDDVLSGSPPAPRAGPGSDAAGRGKAKYRLMIDLAALADSNVTNGTRLREVPILYGDQRIPVPLDPRLRRKSGFGRSAAVAASVKVPVSATARLTAAAEGYFIDYPGSNSDDASATFSAGVELGADGHRTSLEALLFDRWYAQLSAMAGWGVRASHQEAIGPGRSLRAVVEARAYRSGYGRAFDGRQASVWLSYDAVLAPTLTASASAYARRDALRDRAYASTEVGGYGSLSYYLGPTFAGSSSLGLGRAWFDEPIPYLAASSRADWRPWLAVSLTTRRPLLWGFAPSLTYSYGRTLSTLPFYESDRHRLRLGFARTLQ
jgi:hypothetical protein